MTDVFSFHRGQSPLLVSMPHDGTYIPPEIAAGMTEAAKNLPDTDWHVSKLYGFLDDLDVSVVAATHSRYVIDLNRPPDGAALYSGQDETGLCPITSFDGEAIYRDGNTPDKEEIDQRIACFWRPYHKAIVEELDRIKARFGCALLWDAHSIRSQVPRFFQGRLPDLNIGTAGGTTCAPNIQDSLFSIAEKSGYSTALNGRFKGGYITRNYGDPARKIHAIQLEIAQMAYMNEAPPYEYDETKARVLQPVLKDMIRAVIGASVS